MLILIWPLVILFTVILYLFILITLPFSSTAATVFLFTLIAFWSRLPGVGIPSPFWIIYSADVIDLLSLIVAINIGGIYGAVLSLFANIGGRMCGAFTHWGGNISDAIAMFFTCLIIPYVHVWLGSDLFTSMIAFMVIRFIFIVPLDLIGLYNLPLPAYFAELSISVTALFFINSFYTKVFGDFFDNLLVAGVAFNWTLFTFATLVILISYLVMYRFSTKEKRNVLKDNISGLSGAIMEKIRLVSGDKKKKTVEADKVETTENVETVELIEKEEAVKKKKKLVIEIIENGCPLCESVVKGNDERGFYCSNCNIIYGKRDLEIKKDDK